MSQGNFKRIVGLNKTFVDVTKTHTVNNDGFRRIISNCNYPSLDEFPLTYKMAQYGSMHKLSIFTAQFLIHSSQHWLTRMKRMKASVRHYIHFNSHKSRTVSARIQLQPLQYPMASHLLITGVPRPSKHLCAQSEEPWPISQAAVKNSLQDWWISAEAYECGWGSYLNINPKKLHTWIQFSMCGASLAQLTSSECCHTHSVLDGCE